MLLFDREENYLRKLKDVIEAKHTEEINGEDTLQVTTLDEVEKGYRILYKSSAGWKEFVIKGIDESHTAEGIEKKLDCESSFYETLGDYIEDRRPQDTAANIALGIALEPTRWEVGIVDDLGLGSTNFYRTSCKECVQKVAEVWRGELRTRVEVVGNHISHRYVDLLAQRGQDVGKRFTYTKDLESVTKTVHSDDVITALYGYGKGEEITDEEGEATGGYGRRIDFSEINGGKSYVENNDARMIWGRNFPDGKAHVFGKIEFDDCEDKQELLKLTKDKLAEVSQPLITYEAKVIDLIGDKKQVDIKEPKSVRVVTPYSRAKEIIKQQSTITVNGLATDLGDTVAIVDKEFNPELRLKARVVKIVRDLLNPANNELTLGNFVPDITGSWKKQEDYINNFRDKAGVWDRSDIINSDGTINAGYLNDLVDELNDKMNAQGGYVYISDDGQGLITYDKPRDQDPTMAIQLLGGAFRIANSKNAAGEWQWKTFGDGNGFVADSFIGGMLKGGKVEFNLTNGTLLIGDSVDDYALLWDGSKLWLNGQGLDSYATKSYVSDGYSSKKELEEYQGEVEEIYSTKTETEAAQQAAVEAHEAAQSAQEAADTAHTAAQNAQSAADGAAADALEAAGIAEGKGKVIIQGTEPDVADRLPQNLWIDTTGNGNTPKRWDGSAWVAVTDKAATDAADAAVQAQTTANSATSKADMAQSTADTATGKANTAQRAADAAQASADDALIQVGDAKAHIDQHTSEIQQLSDNISATVDKIENLTVGASNRLMRSQTDIEFYPVNNAKVRLHREAKIPYYEVTCAYQPGADLFAAFDDSQFAEPLGELGQVTISLDVLVDEARPVYIEDEKFEVPANRWTRIYVKKSFTTKNTTRYVRYLTTYNRGNQRQVYVGTKLIDHLRVRMINRLCYRNLQVERGNVVTDWSKTPEELEADVNRYRAQLQILADSIALTVSKQEHEDAYNKLSAELKLGADQLNLRFESGNFPLRGKNYHFDIDNFEIGGGSGDVAKHNERESTWQHSDGSYTKISADGLERYVSGTGKKYHYVAKIIKFATGGDGQAPSIRWIKLGSEFVGRSYTIAIVASTSLEPSSAEAGLQKFVLGQAVDSNGNAYQPRVVDGNVEYPVMGYTIYYNPNNQSRRYGDIAGMALIIM